MYSGYFLVCFHHFIKSSTWSLEQRMEIMEEDTVVLADVGVGRRPQLNLEAARSLRDKLDILIEERSAMHDALTHWKHSVIHQPFNEPTVDTKRR